MAKEELEPIEDVLKFIENDLLDDNEQYRFKERRLSINQERWLKRIKTEIEAQKEAIKQLDTWVQSYKKCWEDTKKKLRATQRDNRKLKKNQCHHHPMEIRDSFEVRAEMKRQDDAVKREGHWQG